MNEKPLYKIIDNYIPKEDIEKMNRGKKFEYGYNEKWDIVVISKTGEIGEIYQIEGLMVALPLAPKEVHQRSSKKSEQYWEREVVPNELLRIKSINQWNEMPSTFKTKWTPYIEEQFEYRKHGFWFMNNGVPTYLTGSHWFYLSASKIDVGYPDFREANRIKYVHWEACVADERCFGQIYTKIRRSGHSFEASTDAIDIATLSSDSQIGLLSKTLEDVKGMFTRKVVPINTNLPFYFKPIMEGMDKPKTVLSYAVPATKITKKNMFVASDVSSEGLNTSISYRSSDDNAFDGEKLKYLSIDEAGKLLAPANIINVWRIHKTCLRIGSKIIGKCRMGSTVNAQKKGGEGFQKMVVESDVTKRNANGQTKSGLYSLFIPMEWNMEGFIDRYGMPVLRKPSEPVVGIDGKLIKNGAIDYWEAEVDSLKSDSNALNEFYRQFPRTYAHAFRDESLMSLFNLTKIYQQIDYNDSLIIDHHVTRGYFHWKNGIKDSEVVWTPDNHGRFLVSWIPPKQMQNRVTKKNGMFYPQNEHLGSFGVDSYDISAVVGGRGSNGSMHGMTKGFHMEEVPINEFFLEYIARPETAEIFFEEVLMALFFYGMPALIENNKPRLLYHLKNRGYRAFSINRPDKHLAKLNPSERELGGIPNSSEDIKQAHASCIESYIEKNIGYDSMGTYRSPDEIGSMLFNRTLQDWAKFNIDNREKFDASISSGLCLMANNKYSFLPERKAERISISMGKYDNNGSSSRYIRQ